MTSQIDYSYDAHGRAYQTAVYDVDINAWIIGPPLTSSEVFDSRGDVVVQTSPDSPTVKDVYDGVGEVVDEYDVDAAGDSGAVGVGSDIVLSQTENDYDGDGNNILTVTSDRLPTDLDSDVGPLEDASFDPDAPPARVSAVGMYYDSANREFISANYGTFTTSPQFTTFDYDAAGNQSQVTDPDGLITLSTFDALGQTLETEKGTGTFFVMTFSAVRYL